jgi:hypothetical protein
MMFVNSIEYDGLAAYELSKAQTFCGVPWVSATVSIPTVPNNQKVRVIDDS